MNKKSLVKLKALIDNPQHIQLEYVCTGHSGIRKYSSVIFAHIDESAQFSKKSHLMIKHLMMLSSGNYEKIS